jgi:hypothetical protein
MIGGLLVIYAIGVVTCLVVDGALWFFNNSDRDGLDAFLVAAHIAILWPLAFCWCASLGVIGSVIKLLRRGS